jgi:hypothetical protein
MPYKVKAELVVAKDREGKLRHHYRNADHIGAPINYGSVIPWLSDEQAEHFLRLGLVERIPEEPVAGKVNSEEPLISCLKALERLGVDLAAGAPACRSALRQGGFRYGNDLVAQAVKARKVALEANVEADKMRARRLSGTAS